MKRNALVKLDVLQSCVEPETGKRSERLNERLPVRSEQDEVEVGDAHVVGPDVYLFHDQYPRAWHISRTHGIVMPPKAGSTTDTLRSASSRRRSGETGLSGSRCAARGTVLRITTRNWRASGTSRPPSPAFRTSVPLRISRSGPPRGGSFLPPVGVWGFLSIGSRDPSIRGSLDLDQPAALPPGGDFGGPLQIVYRAVDDAFSQTR